MKLSKKIILSAILCLITIGAFASTCICSYIYNWSSAGFWWSWTAIIWIVNLVIGIYIFYQRNRTEETKTFWLLLMIVLPIIGAIIAWIFNYKLRTEYGKANNDHSKLQSIILRAKKSIKIYVNSFFVSNDTINSLNYARWKGVKIELILSVQKRKNIQEFLIMKLQKVLENKIYLYITSKQIDESFIIIDDQQAICTKTNFNFINIYSKPSINFTTNISKYLKIWNNDIERTSFIPIERNKVKLWKKIKFKFRNIFYPFY